MNAADAYNALVFALKSIIAAIEDDGDDDPVTACERADEIARDALEGVGEST